MKLGISSYTFGWAVGVRDHEPSQPLDENGLLDKAHELGVSLLQIGDNVPLISFSAPRIEKLAERASREGIELEIGGRRLTGENLAAHLDLARRLNAKILRFVVDDVDYHPTPPEIVTVLRQAAPLLREVTLGIENHDRFKAQTLREIIDAAADEGIGVCLDTANSLGAGEGWGEVCGVLAPLTVNLHIKDFAVERLPHMMGFTVTGRPAGQGQLNVPDLWNHLASLGRCQSAILELWTPPQENLQKTIAKEAAWARVSLDYLRNCRAGDGQILGQKPS